MRETLSILGINLENKTMIISDSHNFVFVATTKTGSTSIENHLKFYQSTKYKITHLNDSYNKHCSLKIIYGKFPFIENYFKFAMVRNPFDWVVSWYFYRKSRQNKNNTKNISFKKWLIDENSSAYNIKGIGLSLSQYDIINCNADIKIDFIGRYENIQKDFNVICDKIGIPQQQLPHKNKTKHKHYTEYYDDETREIVAQKYEKDIEYFGYKFGE
jgi:chondroitin 4-sulfotransferase 11